MAVAFLDVLSGSTVSDTKMSEAVAALVADAELDMFAAGTAELASGNAVAEAVGSIGTAVVVEAALGAVAVDEHVVEVETESAPAGLVAAEAAESIDTVVWVGPAVGPPVAVAGTVAEAVVETDTESALSGFAAVGGMRLAAPLADEPLGIDTAPAPSAAEVAGCTGLAAQPTEEHVGTGTGSAPVVVEAAPVEAVGLFGNRTRRELQQQWEQPQGEERVTPASRQKLEQQGLALVGTVRRSGSAVRLASRAAEEEQLVQAAGHNTATDETVPRSVVVSEAALAAALVVALADGSGDFAPETAAARTVALVAGLRVAGSAVVDPEHVAPEWEPAQEPRQRLQQAWGAIQLPPSCRMRRLLVLDFGSVLMFEPQQNARVAVHAAVARPALESEHCVGGLQEQLSCLPLPLSLEGGRQAVQAVVDAAAAKLALGLENVVEDSPEWT